MVTLTIARKKNVLWRNIIENRQQSYLSKFSRLKLTPFPSFFLLFFSKQNGSHLSFFLIPFGFFFLFPFDTHSSRFSFLPKPHLLQTLSHVSLPSHLQTSSLHPPLHRPPMFFIFMQVSTDSLLQPSFHLFRSSHPPIQLLLYMKCLVYPVLMGGGKKKKKKTFGL